MQSNLISTHATIKWKALIYIYIKQMQVQAPFCSLWSIACCHNVTCFSNPRNKKKKKSKNWYQERRQNMFMLSICNQLWNYYMKVPNRNSLKIHQKSIYNTRLLHNGLSLFPLSKTKNKKQKQKTTGAHSTAVWYRRKGQLTDSCLTESNPSSVTFKQQFTFI